MTERLPPLRAVEAFIQVVETSSYGKAALALNITKSAISRRIQSLEDDLGVKLFRRSNRALELTADGQKYFKITRSAFDTLREAGAQIKNTRRDDILRIALPQSFASSWLLPRIGTFYETYPNTDLRLNWRGYFNMFEDEDVDVLLTVTEETPPTLHAEKLMDIVWFPVCSPNLLEQSTATLDSIGGQTLLHLTTMPGAWPQWLNQVGHPELPDGQRGRFFDSMLLALDAAVVGLGLVLCAEPFCQQYLEHGRLIAPYAPRLKDSQALYFVCRKRDVSKRMVRRFRHWLFAQPQFAVASSMSVVAPIVGKTKLLNHLPC